MRFYEKLVIGLCAIYSLNAVIPIKADAAEYIGEYCWNFAKTVDGTPVSGKIQLGVTHIGGGHYLCSGVMMVTDPLFLKVAVFGNAEIIDDAIRVTLSAQGIKFEDRSSYTVGIDMDTITLDPNTFNGTSEGIGIYNDGNELSKGTVTFTSCP